MVVRLSLPTVSPRTQGRGAGQICCAFRVSTRMQPLMEMRWCLSHNLAWAGWQSSPVHHTRVEHNPWGHDVGPGTGRELSRKHFAENKTPKPFQQQSTENRLQAQREGGLEKVRSRGERERRRDQTTEDNPGENGGTEVAKDFLSVFPAGAGGVDGQLAAVWLELRALREALQARSKHSHSLPAAASFKTGSVARALIYLLIAVLLLLWKMFSHRFNSSHSTPLHPDHLWSQTPRRDRAQWLFFWLFFLFCFGDNLTFRRSATSLTAFIKEPRTATRELPLAQSGSVILWDFALSLFFLALVIVSSPSSPAPIYFKQMSYLFIACWRFALAERSFLYFVLPSFFPLNVF